MCPNVKFSEQILHFLCWWDLNRPSISHTVVEGKEEQMLKRSMFDTLTRLLHKMFNSQTSNLWYSYGSKTVTSNPLLTISCAEPQIIVNCFHGTSDCFSGCCCRCFVVRLLQGFCFLFLFVCFVFGQGVGSSCCGRVIVIVVVNKVF